MTGAVLIVEHDPTIAADLFILVEDLGLHVLEPVGSAGEAMDRIDGLAIGAALLDCQLVGETSDGVARALRARGIPFAYVTGLDALPEDGSEGAWPAAPIATKPLRSDTVSALFRDFGLAVIPAEPAP